MSADFLTSLFSSLWSVFLIVLFFGGSIFVHELGHFLAARRRGVKATRFSIGFGPAIWKWTGRDGVEYRLSWIPLGGYVALPQLADMPALEGESENMDQLPPVDYTSRMIVFVAGAVFNMLFALLLATILWVSGRPESEYVTSTTIGYIAEKISLPGGREIVSPAKAAGLLEGDVIKSIDGTKIRNWLDVLNAIVLGTSLDEKRIRVSLFRVLRDGKLKDITVYPVRAGDENVRKVGIDAGYELLIERVTPGSSSAKIGFLADDRITSIEGKQAASWPSLYSKLHAASGGTAIISVLRNGKAVELKTAVPAKNPLQILYGIEIKTNWKLLYQSPIEQIETTLRSSLKTLKAMILPHGDVSLSNVSGPIGITRGFWDALKSEYPVHFVIWFTVMINVSLAFFNLLPIPVLDGGHMMFATIGKLRGKALPFNFVATIQSIFVVLLLSMMAYVTVFGDLRRLVRDNRADAQAREAVAEQQGKSAEPAKP